MQSSIGIIDYQVAIARSGVLEALDPYDPRVVGTLPLRISVAGSDIDIVCHAPAPDVLAETLWDRYRSSRNFCMFRWTTRTRPVVARFEAEGWPFEIFGDPRPVEQQPAWVHFEIERRLLAIDDGRLREAVMQARLLGAKTEPAFAAALGLAGDPYDALVAVARESEEQLRCRLSRL